MRSLHDVATRFWKGELGAAGTALDIVMTPASALFNATATVRNVLYDAGAFPTERVGAPAISVGNIAVGGTGKTPVTAWIARALRDAGRAPAVLHGGYAADEPALHAVLNPDIPVVVGRDRVASARRAIARGADVLVLDDAFQHRRIHRDMDIVLVGAESWSRARHVLPRGPWREEDTALRRASWVVVTRRTASVADAGRVAKEIGQVLHGAPVRVAILNLAADKWSRAGNPVTAAPPGDVFAVTAIADPDSFFANASAAGAAIQDRAHYADHHDYTEQDATFILQRAAARPVITTAKDWIKLRSLLPAERLWVLDQRVVPEQGCEELIADVHRISVRGEAST